jgi:PIN domain nuclease of toxin-antitoxin system
VIVLDTHTLVWWVSDDPLLSKRARTAIEREQPDGDIIVSSISAWEIAMLVERGKLVLSMDVGSWLSTVAQIDAVQFLPVNVDVATKSVDLPGISIKIRLTG